MADVTGHRTTAPWTPDPSGPDDSTPVGTPRFEVDWATRDPQGDAVAVCLHLYNTAGTKVDQVTGLNGSGSGAVLEDPTVTSLPATYDIKLIATDGTAYERDRTQRREADGDTNGCPH